MDGTAVAEPETVMIVERLVEMAATLATAPGTATPAGLVQLLTSRPHPDLCTKSGTFASYRKKGKWATSAKQAGLSKADGDRLNDAAEIHYTACCDAWNALVQAAAGHALSALIDEAHPILQRYRHHKRASAQLDFDDLIFAARDLLRDHDDVRRALGQRFAHVLVDEFQDTDPLQTEIFWRLCGEPADDANDWTGFRIRPGALFLVGDPKQAIYRFRGGDLRTYLQAREYIRAQAASGDIELDGFVTKDISISVRDLLWWWHHLFKCSECFIQSFQRMIIEGIHNVWRIVSRVSTVGELQIRSLTKLIPLCPLSLSGFVAPQKTSPHMSLPVKVA